MRTVFQVSWEAVYRQGAGPDLNLTWPPPANPSQSLMALCLATSLMVVFIGTCMGTRLYGGVADPMATDALQFMIREVELPYITCRLVSREAACAGWHITLTALPAPWGSQEAACQGWPLFRLRGGVGRRRVRDAHYTDRLFRLTRGSLQAFSASSAAPRCAWPRPRTFQRRLSRGSRACS